MRMPLQKKNNQTKNACDCPTSHEEVGQFYSLLAGAIGRDISRNITLRFTIVLYFDLCYNK